MRVCGNAGISELPALHSPVPAGRAFAATCRTRQPDADSGLEEKRLGLRRAAGKGSARADSWAFGWWRAGSRLPDLEPVFLVPVDDRLVRVFAEVLCGRDPSGTSDQGAAKSSMIDDVLWRLGQGRVDRRRERIDPFRPSAGPRPRARSRTWRRSGAAPGQRRLLGAALLEPRAIDGDVVRTAHLQRRRCRP